MNVRVLCLLLVAGGLVTASLAEPGAVITSAVEWSVPESSDEGAAPPLPRWREGGTPYNARQSLYPMAIDLTTIRDEPTSGLIESPPEYAPVHGVLYRFITGHWPTTVADCVATLTSDPNHDEIAYVAVTGAAAQQQATNYFLAAGADMSKVQFVFVQGESVWMRDYGPHFIWQDGALAIVDSHYYPGRPNDNFLPTLVGDNYFGIPTYDMGLYYSGGNFQPGPNRTAFASALVLADNPSSEGFTEAFIRDLYDRFKGIDTLHIMPQLPSWVDGTGHIDMWMYLIDDDTVIISEFLAGSDSTAIQITNNAVPYMQALGYTVYRPRAWTTSSAHYTYTNAYRVNDRIFIPMYGGSYATYDSHALGRYMAAAGPDVQIIQINCASIIPAAGAIHCIVKQVPRRVDEGPAVHVIAPAGGELVGANGSYSIKWAATDTYNRAIPQIDLYYSLDDGDTWEFITSTSHTGGYTWAVPNVASYLARVKVVATSVDALQGEALSSEAFEILPVEQSVYNFATGAGIDRWARGYQTWTWNGSVAGQLNPVTTDISSLQADAYDRIAASDASGSVADPNRYQAPVPTSGYESTHTFRFTIATPPDEIDDIGLLWEGFANDCAQVELYIWDYYANNWSDGAGAFGQNYYVDSWAGNADGYLEGHIRADIQRYISATGQLTLLVYAERPGNRTYHDYVEVRVSTIALSPGDMNCDGVINAFDIDPFVLGLTDPAAYQAAYPECYLLNGDLNGDGLFNAFDIDPFVQALVGG